MRFGSELGRRPPASQILDDTLLDSQLGEDQDAANGFGDHCEKCKQFDKFRAVCDVQAIIADVNELSVLEELSAFLDSEAG